MSNNRLDESTIRRFMGLAGIQPLGENFLDRLQEEEPEEAPMDDMAAEEPPMDAEPAPEMDAEPAPEATEAATEIAQDVADAVADAMTTALGKHGVTVSADSGDAEAPMDVEPELDAEPAPEAPEDAMAAEEPALEEGAEETTTETTETEEETLEEETPKDDALTQLEAVANELEKKEEVVQEVARRVVERLLNTIQK